jgi:hypothetical protein
MPPPPPALRYVTLNLLHGGVLSGLTGSDQDLERRLDLATDALAALRPDVVGLQEASTGRRRGNVAERLGSRLGLHHAYAPAAFRLFPLEWLNRGLAARSPPGPASTASDRPARLTTSPRGRLADRRPPFAGSDAVGPARSSTHRGRPPANRASPSWCGRARPSPPSSWATSTPWRVSASPRSPRPRAPSTPSGPRTRPRGPDRLAASRGPEPTVRRRVDTSSGPGNRAADDREPRRPRCPRGPAGWPRPLGRRTTTGSSPTSRSSRPDGGRRAT